MALGLSSKAAFDQTQKPALQAPSLLKIEIFRQIVAWVSGMVEAFSRKLKVKDLESLSEDIPSARGFWRNKVTRILPVMVFTNLGSSIGTFVAIPLMAKALE